MSMPSSGPLFVRLDDEDNLFLCDSVPTDFQCDEIWILEDAALWHAYTTAQEALYKAECAVRSNLCKPLEIKNKHVPTQEEIYALANLHLADRLRSRQKISAHLGALANVSNESIKAAWFNGDTVTAEVSDEMRLNLLRKGWINGLAGYTLKHAGIEVLEEAAITYRAVHEELWSAP